MINSCTGYKSANLIGTQSENGSTNLAVFNSVTHLGSNPPLIGFILRPTTVPRHTYQNMKNNGFFTINHIHKREIEDAHHTSDKYTEEVSEYEQNYFTEEFKKEIKDPIVKNDTLQMG